MTGRAARECAFSEKNFNFQDQKLRDYIQYKNIFVSSVYHPTFVSLFIILSSVTFMNSGSINSLITNRRICLGVSFRWVRVLAYCLSLFANWLRHLFICRMTFAYVHIDCVICLCAHCLSFMCKLTASFNIL